jgi:hypothetical protein
LSSDNGGGAHSLDATTMTGLIDIVTLGNLVELCWAYDPSRNEETQKGQGARARSDLIDAQRVNVLKMYLKFQREFALKHRLTINEEALDPDTALFRPSILRLAVSICQYKKREDRTNPELTYEMLSKRIQGHFQVHRPELLQELREDLEKDPNDLSYMVSFDWMGPSFEVDPVHGHPSEGTA